MNEIWKNATGPVSQESDKKILEEYSQTNFAKPAWEMMAGNMAKSISNMESGHQVNMVRHILDKVHEGVKEDQELLEAFNFVCKAYSNPTNNK